MSVLSGGETLFEASIKMAKGNPGALNVIAQLSAHPDGASIILCLDKMGITGSRIWVLYKDLCGQDIRKMIEMLEKRPPKFVAFVNEEINNER